MKYGTCPMCDGSGMVLFQTGNKNRNGEGSLYQSSTNLRWYGSIMRKGKRRTVSSMSRTTAERRLRELIDDPTW